MATSYSPKIITDGLVLCLDAGDGKSYSGSGTTWTDRSGNGLIGTINGATFNSTSKTFSFDGTDDYIALNGNVTVPAVGFTVMMAININDSQSSSGWNYWFYEGANDGHKYEFGQYGTTGNRFHFKDNFNQSSSNMTATLDSSGFTIFHFGSTSSSYSFFSRNAEAKVLSNGNAGWTGGNDITFDQFFRGGSAYYGAEIGNILIYNKELSQNEIIQNYNAIKGRFGL